MFCRLIASFTLNLIRGSSLRFKMNLIFCVTGSKENYKTQKKHIAGVVEVAAVSCTVSVKRNKHTVRKPAPLQDTKRNLNKCNVNLSSVTEILESAT
jgi:hypothetical protein